MDGNGDPVTFDGNPTFYQLAGQSAFMQTRTGSLTSSGQLDGATGLGHILFTEGSPPALLSDYLTYSYLGVVEFHGTDVNGDPVLLDQSIVIAFQPGTAEGFRLDELFPAYTESALVTAFTTSFDSPEFLDMAFTQVVGQPGTSGAIAVQQTDCHGTLSCDFPTQVQVGDTLDLIAFIGGAGGDEGVLIGRIDFGVLRQLNVPEPSSLSLFAVGAFGLYAAGRRRIAG